MFRIECASLLSKGYENTAKLYNSLDSKMWKKNCWDRKMFKEICQNAFDLSNPAFDYTHGVKVYIDHSISFRQPFQGHQICIFIYTYQTFESTNYFCVE